MHQTVPYRALGNYLQLDSRVRRYVADRTDGRWVHSGRGRALHVGLDAALFLGAMAALHTLGVRHQLARPVAEQFADGKDSFEIEQVGVRIAVNLAGLRAKVFEAFDPDGPLGTW